MVRARSFVRVMSLVLLAFAAVDLSYPVSCMDTVIAGTAQSTVCGGDQAADAGHDGDDCFCCSRTVRAEWANAFAASDTTGQAFLDSGTSLIVAPATPPYHPPLR